MNQDFRNKYGSWAIVAGASEGLGEAYAKAAAAKGLNVVLIARRQNKLVELSDAIKDQYRVEIRSVVCDLSDENAMSIIEDATKDIKIGLMVYNAAYSVIGSFLKLSAKEHAKMIAVNCHMPAQMVHHFGQAMKTRQMGGIILMSSLSGYQGSPLIASYAATKAYNRILAESLWFEMREFNVDVLACCAGATSTPNFINSNPKETSKMAPPVLSPDRVVELTLKALGKQPVIIPGRFNYLAANLMKRLMPTKISINIMGDTTHKMYPDKK